MMQYIYIYTLGIYIYDIIKNYIVAPFWAGFMGIETVSLISLPCHALSMA